MSIERARAVADAVLYEGYLLYPYRATSGKNQVRWQFGVLGPQGAERVGVGEGSAMSVQTLLRVVRPEPVEGQPLRSSTSSDHTTGSSTEPDLISVHVRFLQVQQRRTERAAGTGFVEVSELRVADQRWFSWDEAVEVEREHRLSVSDLIDGCSWPVEAEDGEDTEELRDSDGRVAGRLVRRREGLRASVSARLEPVDGLYRLTVAIDNQAEAAGLDKDDALRRSLVGTHVIIEASAPSTQFVSVIDPPPDAVAAAAGCRQQRCWPVLAGPAGSTDLLLGSPIILYDHPEIAPESAGALFDGTEIDEILTLRVMTMTEEEKAEARATDPRAREIIDRCDQMSAAELQQLHGALRDPRAGIARSGAEGQVPPEFAEAVAAVQADAELPWFDTGGSPWWDPAVDERVQPEVDAVLIDGVSVSKGSLVRVHPARRADAQDLFFADQVARVTAVLSDVDGAVHVALVLVDDPAADLHDWYGRYLYFAPDELEPLLDHPESEHLATRPGKES